MPRGGYRPGAGRKRKTRTATIVADAKTSASPRPVFERRPAPTDGSATVAGNAPPPDGHEQSAVGNDPLEYMLAVIRDPLASQDRKDRLAIAAAPFMHAKVGEGGKKEQKGDAAKKAARGRFAPAAPPKSGR